MLKINSLAALCKDNANDATALGLALIELEGLERTWCARRIIRMRRFARTPLNLWDRPGVLTIIREAP